jgi:hypothetical protein
MVCRKLISLILLGLILVGCSEDEISPQETEVFSGELMVTRTKDWLPWTDYFTDTVILTIEGSTYKLDHVTNESSLCNSSGIAAYFGTNRLIFTPTFVDGFNCDHLKIPQGEFKSVFSGDSLYLGPETLVFSGQYPYTMIYEFQLTK